MSKSIELSAGIIIDTDGGQAYVMAPEGGVTAVALQDGATLWHSDAVEKPLLLSENLLLGQAVPPASGEGVAIRMLRVDGRGDVASEGVVPLPGGVDPIIEPTADRGFSVSAEPLNGDAMLRWEFRERPLRGLATGPDEVLPEEVLPDMGPARRMLGAAPADAEAAPEAEADETVVRGQVRLSPADGTVRPMVEPSIERAPPSVPQFTAARVDVAPEASRAEAPEDPLVFQSADGAHRLRSVPTDDGDDLWTIYRWELYETGASTPLGTIKLHVSFAPFVVTDGRVIVELQPYAHVKDGTVTEEPMQLRAYDLTSGERLWSTPVRDIYAVPEPPH